VESDATGKLADYLEPTLTIMANDLEYKEKVPPRYVRTGKYKRWKAAAQPLRQVPNWSAIRRSIMDRDGYACRVCGATTDESDLHVHHVDWDRANNRRKNLVTLCQDCHQGVHAEGYRPDGSEREPWGERTDD
jgi:5-methylcytosine-specific restriction endonuclease McrA